MQQYTNKPIRFDDEEETPKEMPENPMEKMVSGWQFDKKFIEQRKIFLWGVVDDTSTTGRSLTFPVVSVGPRFSPVAVATGTTPARGQVASACRRRQTPRPCSASRGRPGRRRRFPPSGPSTSAASGLPGCCLCTQTVGATAVDGLG